MLPIANSQAAAHSTRYGVALDSRQADKDSIEVNVNCSHNNNLYSDIHTTVTSLIDFTEVSLKFYQTHFLSTK